jgi:hypothetical protein
MPSRPLLKINADFADRDTDSAWLIRLPNGREVWIPKSVCHHAKDGSFMCPAWVVRDRDMEEFAK